MLFKVGLLFACCLVVAGWWKPTPGTTWAISYDGIIDTTLNVQMFLLPMPDVYTPLAITNALKARGVKLMCYINPTMWVVTNFDASNFSTSILGNPPNGYPNARWVDIRSPLKPEVAIPLLWEMDHAKSVGCDGIFADVMVTQSEVDSGFPITAADEKAFQIWYAQETHKRNLSIGENFSGGGIPQETVQYLDWNLDESCFRALDDCCARSVNYFINQNKAVFQIEYMEFPGLLPYRPVGDTYHFPTGSKFGDAPLCPEAEKRKFSTVIKYLNVSHWTYYC